MSRCQVAGGLIILNAEAVAAGQASQQIIIRTRFWDDALLDAQDDGVSQVVILAAGMDARAYRLPWRAGTTVYEVDQPQVIAAKDERLAGERPRLSAKTVWLVEGLRQYLDASAVDHPGGGASAASRSDFSTKRVVLSNRMRQAAVPAPAWTNVWEAMVPLITGLGLRHAD
jgi:hypothetical protein